MNCFLALVLSLNTSISILLKRHLTSGRGSPMTWHSNVVSSPSSTRTSVISLTNWGAFPVASWSVESDAAEFKKKSKGVSNEYWEVFQACICLDDTTVIVKSSILLRREVFTYEQRKEHIRWRPRHEYLSLLLCTFQRRREKLRELRESNCLLERAIENLRILSRAGHRGTRLPEWEIHISVKDYIRNK